MAQVPEGSDRIGAAIDITWAMFQSDTFAAWFELIIAGRTDADLRPHVPGGRRPHERDDRGDLVRAVRPPPSDDPARRWRSTQAAPMFLFAVLDGLAVSRMTGMPGADAEAERCSTSSRLAASVALVTPEARSPS